MFKKIFSAIKAFFTDNPYRYGYRDDKGNYISQKDAVLSYIKDNSHCTRDDVVYGTKARKTSVLGRIAELLNEGKIYEYGDRYNTDTGKYNAKLVANTTYTTKAGL